MDWIRHRILLSAIKSESTPETIYIYDYDTAPTTINGTILQGSYTALNDAGIVLRVQGSGYSACTIGSYNLTDYAMLKIVGGIKNYNITGLYVGVLNSDGTQVKSISLSSSMASNSTSNFTANSGNYSTHYIDVSDLRGMHSIQLYISANGTTQISLVAFKQLALITEASSDPLIDRVIISGTGQESGSSQATITIDGTTYFSDNIVDLSKGQHTVEIVAYRITIFGATNESSTNTATIYWQGAIAGGFKAEIKTITIGSGLFATTQHEIIVSRGDG